MSANIINDTYETDTNEPDIEEAVEDAIQAGME